MLGSGWSHQKWRGMSTNSNGASGHRRAELLRWHQRHLGLYARVAAKLGVTQSYVSLVARGLRHSDKITAALSNELERMLEAAARGTRKRR